MVYSEETVYQGHQKSAISEPMVGEYVISYSSTTTLVADIENYSQGQL